MKLKLAGHETFYPREHWLYKGLGEKDAKITSLKAKQVSGFFKDQEESNEDYPTDYMGVGVNMVKAIRHWVNVFGLLDKEDKSDFIKPILNYDPFLDKTATSWILHYNLITSETAPTTWHWFFTQSELVSFDKESFLRSYKDWLSTLDLKQTYSEKSLENDYQVLTAMYSRDDRDLFYPSQFASLGVLSFNPHYRRYSRSVNPDLDISILLYLFLLFRDRFFRAAETLDLENIRNIAESPLRALKIDIDHFFELSMKLPSKISKKVKLSRTAGIKTIQFFGLTKNDLLSEIYSSEKIENYLD
jgi:hypothetical protein